MKIILVVGIIAGLAAVSAKAQEGCDGPVLVSGMTVNTCGTCSGGTCPGSTGVRNDYYECGGSGFTYCSQMNATVGYSQMPCTSAFNSAQWVLDNEYYQDCLTDQKHNDPSRNCPKPQLCDYITCSPGTTGGQPIILPIVYDLGDNNGCWWVMLQKSPFSSLAVTSSGHPDRA